MKDVSTVWQYGVETVLREVDELPSSLRTRLTELLVQIMRCKKTLFAVATEVDAADICQACGGACCSRGRYHFSAIDLLAYCITNTPLFTPDFTTGSCPFLLGNKCAMTPQYRPFTCITFHCEPMDELFSTDQRDQMRRLEANLTYMYDSLESLLATRLRGGLLHYAEVSLDSGGGILLRRNTHGNDR